MRISSVFGLALASDFTFAHRLPDASGPPGLTFTCADADPIGDDGWRRSAPRYVSPLKDEAGETVLRVHDAGAALVMSFSQAEYFLFDDRIVCRRLGACDRTVEVHLLSAVLACWLERAGVPAFHASAVALRADAGAEGRGRAGAVAFLSTSGGGKSTLAAGLMRAGHALVTDDVLAVRESGGGWLAEPGMATMRLWPGEAARFTGCVETWPRVHARSDKRLVPIGPGGWAAFCDEPAPIAAIVVPERLPEGEAGDEVVVDRIRPREALIEVVRHSFAARLVRALGWQPARLTRLSAIAGRVPVYRLVYRSGFERLDRVCGAVEQMVEAGARRR